MKPNGSFLSGSKLIPIKIIFPYAVLSLLWIYTSNSILLNLFQNHQTLKEFLDFKGYIYVATSSIILYSLFQAATYSLRHSEKKYRHLFENAAVSIWEEDFSAVKGFFEHQRAMGVTNWKEYFENNPQAVKQCASMVKIIDFNQLALQFLGIKDKELAPRNLDYYFSDRSYETFKEELIALANGETQWTGDISARSLKGNSKDLMFQLNVVPGYEYDLSKILISTVDITERKNIEKILLQKENYLRQVIDLVPHFIFAKDNAGRFILVNRAIAENYGTTVEGLVGKTDADFIKNKEQVEHFVNDDMEVIRSGKPKFIAEEPITNAQGQIRLLSTTKIPFTASGSNTPSVLGVAVDITEYKKVEEELLKSQHLNNSILNSTPNLIYVFDMINNKNVYCNREAEEFFGYTSQQIQEMGENFFKKVVHPDDVTKVTEHHHSFIVEGDVREIEHRMKNAKGQWRWLRCRNVLFVRTPTGEPWQILGTAEDISEQKNLENRVLTLAHYDTVTMLPNRTLFFERAGLGLSNAKRSNVSCAILFVDLDRFTTVNDTLGHTVGDRLLKDTAVRLTECVREIDTIARMGGDKFIVFLNGLEEPQSAQHIAERIREKFNASRQILGHDLFVTASVGIATYPNDGDNLEDLLKNADTALYSAKEAGRNNFSFFDGTMNEKAVSRMHIERGLREALKKEELQLFYQPIIGVQDGAVRGFEALLRWHREGGVSIPPNDFIYIAEETGLIIPIGEWVLKEACKMGVKLQKLGFEEMVMSVNISVVQLRNKSIVETIKKALEESGLSADSLEIEITESFLIGSVDASIDVLRKIRDMGVKISLDDFGTGYSSLSHLQRLPITSLKIDRLFIKELMNEGIEMAMTATIIDLAHTLDLGVIAEGVEHDLQLKSLSQKRCDYFQGFLCSRPMPEDSAIAFLEENSS
jgi:diguanylate cyclase (GGDEF)-like protein/PAS domain S-box-containing protein